jgi:hypothetical protein
MSYNQYDRGAALEAHARELIGRRIGQAAAAASQTAVYADVMELTALYGVPVPAVKAQTPTLLERLEKEASDLENSLASVSAQLAKRQAQIEELRRYPEDDPYADDTVLRFKKVFPGDPNKLYQYTASKVEGLWYVTGAKSPDGVEWADLISWLGLGVTDITKIAPGRAAKVAWSDPK